MILRPVNPRETHATGATREDATQDACWHACCQASRTWEAISAVFFLFPPWLWLWSPLNFSRDVGGGCATPLGQQWLNFSRDVSKLLPHVTRGESAGSSMRKAIPQSEHFEGCGLVWILRSVHIGNTSQPQEHRRNRRHRAKPPKLKQTQAVRSTLCVVRCLFRCLRHTYVLEHSWQA